MIFPKTAALLKKHHEAKDKSFNRINTMAPIRSQVAILNAQYTEGLPVSPDLITVSQEQVVLQNPFPSAGPSLIPTASPQQRVNSAMEGMIGVPAQAVFHSRVAQVHARRGSHGALIPQPASADEYKGKRKSTCSFCGHFM